jgi:hypothetical protein
MVRTAFIVTFRKLHFFQICIQLKNDEKYDLDYRMYYDSYELARLEVDALVQRTSITINWVELRSLWHYALECTRIRFSFAFFIRFYSICLWVDVWMLVRRVFNTYAMKKISDIASIMIFIRICIREKTLM